MPGYRRDLLCLLLLVIVLPACSGSKENAGTSNAQQEAGGSSSGTIAGRWKVSFNQSVMNYDLCILDISEAGEGFEVKLVALAPMFDAATLQTAEVTDKTNVHVVFATPQGGSLDVQGTLKSGVISGSLLVPTVTVATAKLTVSDQTSIDGSSASRPLPKNEDFRAALESKDPAAFINEFITANPTSPLALDAFNVMFQIAKNEKLTEDQAQGFFDRDLRLAQQWGPVIEHKIYFEVGSVLARQNYLPEFALKLLTQAESYLTPESPDDWRLLLGEGYVSLGKTEEGVALIRPIYERHPKDMRISYSLAKGLEKIGEVDKALDLYAELAVLPLVENDMLRLAAGAAEQLPGERVAQLWTQKHGSTEGLDAFLKEAEKKNLQRYVSERKDVTPPDEGTRVAFLEVFTGASCPPCVAADVAATALQASYSPKELVMIQYHQHIPALNPLANDDSIQRLTYYKLLSSPHILINGVDSPGDGNGVGGDLDRAAPVCQHMQAAVDKIIAEKTDLRLELSAHADNGKIKIAAKVSGMDAFPETHRLRLALVEDEIEFIAPNGIRTHMHVVRSMPGGADGISPKEGKLSFETEASLSELKAGLEKQLAATEEKYQMEFAVKPLALKSFQLVAFVQNDETNEVLQAAMVPVDGQLDSATPSSAAPATEAAPEKP